MRDQVLLQVIRSVRRAAREWIWKRTRQKHIDDYLKSQEVPRLQIGAGPYALPDWLNTDYSPNGDQVVFLDASKRFPFSDGTFKYVFSEHVIEHIPFEAGENMLRECFRVLRPGGAVRIATPDLDKIAGLICPSLDEDARDYIRWFMSKYRPDVGNNNPCYVINDFMHLWGHQFIYNRQALSDSLEAAGFVEIRAFSPGVSDEPLLHGIESHGKHIGEHINAFETIVLEATRL